MYSLSVRPVRRPPPALKDWDAGRVTPVREASIAAASRRQVHGQPPSQPQAGRCLRKSRASARLPQQARHRPNRPDNWPCRRRAAPRRRVRPPPTARKGHAMSHPDPMAPASQPPLACLPMPSCQPCPSRACSTASRMSPPTPAPRPDSARHSPSAAKAARRCHAGISFLPAWIKAYPADSGGRKLEQAPEFQALQHSRRARDTPHVAITKKGGPVTEPAHPA